MTLLTVWHCVNGELVRKGRTPEVVDPPPADPVERRFPGDPNPTVTGQLWWGAAIGTNSSPSTHETAAGTTLALRRRFYNDLADIAVPNGALLQAVREDHAAGRLPWVSFKIPQADWDNAGAGEYDTTFDALIAELESYAKPTWLTINHEPENDYESVYGSSATSAQKASWTATYAPRWRSMQSRFRARLTAFGSIQRIAFGSSLMYYTFNPTSGRDPEDWWPGAGVWDFHGNDHYTEPSQTITRTNPWGYFVDFCEAKGIPFVCPEWGLRKEDTNGASRMQAFFDLMTSGAYDCVALAYFDSGANSTGTGWTLTNDHGLLDTFHSIMQDERAINLSDLGY